MELIAEFKRPIAWTPVFVFFHRTTRFLFTRVRPRFAEGAECSARSTLDETPTPM
jgi:hypothetical protein